MSVVHFKTVHSEVISTNIQVFYFWQELFVPAKLDYSHCFHKFFLLTGKRWNQIPFLPSL